ncbi:hypothetical protein AGR4C_Cc80240 [Agrobacterium tumefaciens str. Kerr 14]|uniref:Uncharacterized protein n=1 Tax=Agrobacterium tumefaciens str. Kerr 14 TaxID=1183424 RepID=A0A1S7QM78_AGRTU|nr:hypothetical protein AGR4C_Cc80240 [Agrobacterium tumefaciens str. Kerr 14]
MIYSQHFSVNMCHAFKALLHGIFLHMVRATLSIQTATQGGMNGAAKTSDRIRPKDNGKGCRRIHR